MATATRQQIPNRARARSSWFSGGSSPEPLVAYFADLERTPRLDREEEQRLAQGLEQATDASSATTQTVPRRAVQLDDGLGKYICPPIKDSYGSNSG